MIIRFEHNGLQFKATTEPDSDMGAPWVVHDGHGVVTEWVLRGREAGEWLLSADGLSRRYYDWKASLAKALEEKWGPAKEGQSLEDRAMEAVNADYEYLRGWCSGEWFWMFLDVQLLDVNGEKVPGFSHSLGGIASNSDLDAAARELADDISRAVGKRKLISVRVRV